MLSNFCKVYKKTQIIEIRANLSLFEFYFNYDSASK